jgi:hypothetical protein
MRDETRGRSTAACFYFPSDIFAVIDRVNEASAPVNQPSKEAFSSFKREFCVVGVIPARGGIFIQEDA